jgi:hypothetical protein
VVRGFGDRRRDDAWPRGRADNTGAELAIARGRTLGLRIGGGPPEQLNEIMAKVTQIYAKVIKSANIKAD